MASEAAQADAGHQQVDGHGQHSPFLQHHFEDHKHQFRTSKTGVWLFLCQEILFFGGLFCAYFVYRSLHPEIFFEGHRFLDVKWGAFNTCVLLFSSLTAAWSVRCAQLNQQRGLVITIALTIMCAFGFLGIKYVEYSHKFHEGLMWGQSFNPSETAFEEAHAANPPAAGGPGVAAVDKPEPRRRLHIFFSIYFAMTGLHGIHVLLGIAVYSWVLVRAIKGHFGPEYYGPVDFVALYWHLVDLVWIYLFPLMYLIH